ncbi:hypothetical protein HOU03_gp432 [Caulobacter phage CcrSC]|uniref:Uncharacterized protein n=1 Tax=Caulobacter phage CcrSC TaxID=2283272 RepID=A0A385EDT7_9CAUD|nr:hypothetical protein HOU03_gp432 [Caulobacter phage CcrSC]AXQ69836.1 hypothetical protein CcrSC_gp254c [Caulobacter phage CcrSC]
MKRSLFGLAAALLMASAAQAADFVPPQGVDYLPPYALRSPISVPAHKRPILARSAEEMIEAQIGQPARILMVSLFAETDGSYTYCGVYGTLGSSAVFIMNTGDKARTHEGRLYNRNVGKDMLGAFGCADKVNGVSLR